MFSLIALIKFSTMVKFYSRVFWYLIFCALFGMAQAQNTPANGRASLTSSSLAEQTVTFTANGSFTVPDGITSINVLAKGTRGGNNGGGGGIVSATLSVTPGEVLLIKVAAKGGNGFSASNFGGGATDIRTSEDISTRILVAGGGGGKSQQGAGGAGGGLTGGDGGTPSNTNAGGKGGTQSEGGAGGIGAANGNGADGSLGQGGNANSTAGGGGGAGYYGGGGGAYGTGASGGAGGGGSSYTDPTRCSNVEHTQGGNLGAGSLVITYSVSNCTFTPTNITVTSAKCISAGSYVPNGQKNGTYSWVSSPINTKEIYWNNTLQQWEISYYGGLVVAFNKTGSKTNLPCDNWETIGTDDENCGTIALSGGCGSLVAQNVTPAVSIAPNPSGSIFSGTNVAFTATPTNGGTAPSYQWKKNDTNVGTNSATYSDAALANGDKIKVVMTSNDGCASPTAATSNELTMTVNTAPAALCITTECPGVSGNFTKGSDYNGRPTYSRAEYSLFQADQSWFLVSGEVGNRDNIVYEIHSTDQIPPTTGWGSNICDEIELTIDLAPCACVNPTAYTVSGGGSYCSGATSNLTVSLSNSETGVNYQLKNGSTNVGTPKEGTGAGLTFENITNAGTYTVEATRVAGGCTQAMTGSAVVTVISLPTSYNVTGGGPYCAGGSGSAVGLASSQTGVNYQLKKDGVNVGSAVAGSGSALAFGNKTDAGTYTVEATTATGGCTLAMAGNAVVSVVALPTAFTVTGGGSLCSGAAGVSIGLSNSESGVSYQLKKDGVNVGSVASGTGSALSFGTFTMAGTYTVEASKAGGSPTPVRIGVGAAAPPTTTTCTQTMTGSAVVTVISLPTSYNVTGGGPYCAGGNGSAVGLANSQTGVNYQLKKDGVNVGSAVAGSGSALAFGNKTDAGTYTVEATTATGGCTLTMTGNAVVSVLALPTVYSVTGGGSFCPGGTGVTVGLSGSESGVSYQLKKDGVNVSSAASGTGSAISFGEQSNTGTYTVVATNNTTSCSTAMTGSASVTIYALPTAVVSGTVSVCKGGSAAIVTFTGSNGVAPYAFGYQVNGGDVQTVTTAVGSTTATVSQTTSVHGIYTYTLVSVSDANCSQTQGGSAVVTVQTKPTIVLSTLQQTLNEGNSQTFCDIDANPVNSLQFNVSGLCVVGSPVWRVQVGSGVWSDWTTNSPVSQLSNNQLHRYQAACDATCPSTYTNPIELTINYRASVPQNVSLLVDGVTVAAGETKEVCSVSNTALTFNASCGAGEMVLYSVDGGEYSSVMPTSLVDNQFHNYRVRCRKSDGTPSCVESESGVMRLKLVTIPSAPTVSLTTTSGCDAAASFSGQSSCGNLKTVWYNAATNVALPNLPSTVPSETTSYYARCQTENGCVSEKSSVVTFTKGSLTEAPVVNVSSDIVCTGVDVTVSTNCPAGFSPLWNTGVTEPSFVVSFANVTKQSYSVRCVSANGCQSSVSPTKEVMWKAFVVTVINIGQSKSAVKANDRAAWSSQFVTRDGGPELDQSTQDSPTLYYSENLNKTAPRYWTIHVDACGLGESGSLTYDLLAVPETGVVRSYNTHENSAPYFMFANRSGYTELYAQNHPLYGFFESNGAGGNVYDEGFPKGLYKLGIRYWDMKGWGSIYPSTRKPQGNVLAYQEYWFRIQSKDGIGVGAARTAEIGEEGIKGEGQNASTFATVVPNPVSKVLRLKIQANKGQAVETTLTDASGRRVLSRQFTPETNTHQEEFGVSELPTGMYFLKVNAGDKQATLKVVKVD